MAGSTSIRQQSTRLRSNKKKQCLKLIFFIGNGGFPECLFYKRTKYFDFDVWQQLLRCPTPPAASSAADRKHRMTLRGLPRHWVTKSETKYITSCGRRVLSCRLVDHKL